MVTAGPRKELDEENRFAGNAGSGVCSRSCRGSGRNYNFDRDTDFSKFKSYKWVDIRRGSRSTISPRGNRLRD